MSSKINVKGVDILLYQNNDEDFISLTTSQDIKI